MYVEITKLQNVFIVSLCTAQYHRSKQQTALVPPVSVWPVIKQPVDGVHDHIR